MKLYIYIYIYIVCQKYIFEETNFEAGAVFILWLYFFKITYWTKDVFVVQKGNVVMIPSA